MSGNKKPTTVEVAQRIIRPVLDKMGLTLWDTRFEKEGSSWYLRYFVDKEDAHVTIGELEEVSRAVDKLLDEEDPISQSYVLEVSSPGMERALVRDEHFARYAGHDVAVRLIRPVEGVRDFVGRLMGKSGDEITILLDEDVEMVIKKAEAAYIRLYIDFETGGLDK